LNTIFNITNGDYLAGKLKQTAISGKIITCREALVTGPLQADYPDELWKIRAAFISENYSDEKVNYYQKVVSEFEKMKNIPAHSEVNLWFEDDLFCQVNMWFCLTLLPKDRNIKIHRVFPKNSSENNWEGFSDSNDVDLQEALESKILFYQKDIDLGCNLWKAYQSNDPNTLKQLSLHPSDCFHFLQELIDAYQNINPETFVRNLMQDGTMNFIAVFEKFRNELGIFGFGDLQIKQFYDKILGEK
jgi:hypothetical protein